MSRNSELLTKIKTILHGIDSKETSHPDGWWETSSGAEFGAETLRKIEELLEEPESEPIDESKLINALSCAMRAIVLTRDHVGSDVLPAIRGWEWFESAITISTIIPHDKWTTEFIKRLDSCPICESDTGLKLPNGDSAYCEDCEFPGHSHAYSEFQPVLLVNTWRDKEQPCFNIEWLSYPTEWQPGSYKLYLHPPRQPEAEPVTLSAESHTQQLVPPRQPVELSDDEIAQAQIKHAQTVEPGYEPIDLTDEENHFGLPMAVR